MAQKLKKMRKKIKAASNRHILRQQMELLTELSRTRYYDICPIAESSQAMAAVHKELVKAESILFVRIPIVFFGFLYLLKRIGIKMEVDIWK